MYAGELVVAKFQQLEARQVTETSGVDVCNLIRGEPQSLEGGEALALEHEAAEVADLIYS